MIKKSKVHNVLEKEDVERIVSKFLGKEVKVSEMDITIVDLIPSDFESIEDTGLDCILEINGRLIMDEEGLCPFVDRIFNQALLEEKYIFAFDVKEFKSYKRTWDCSD